jgi:hypothetical protein
VLGRVDTHATPEKAEKKPAKAKKTETPAEAAPEAETAEA